MLWTLCARPKPWIFSSLSLSHSLATRFVGTPIRVAGYGGTQPPPRLHSSACHTGNSSGGGASLIWHAILPSDYGGCRRPGPTSFLNEQKGEGSWNVAWDARPARWLHHSDSAWFLFGVCACLSVPLDCAVSDGKSEAPVACSNDDSSSIQDSPVKDPVSPSPNYRVKGVLPDGRCLFRSIAHLACLRKGEEAPDENRQRELADELRAQVVDELLRRREESEWFIEGDFDDYVRNIQKPSVWGGEPELMMACHVLRTSISIFATDRVSGSLVKIAHYGEEYRKDKEKPMTLMYHWYGHYDILEGDVSHECYANKI